MTGKRWPPTCRRGLRRLGIPQTEIVSQERCVIPMDLPLRLGAGRVIPVGAAAGWVHPAAGYSIAMAARKAKRLAELISSGIRDAAQLRAQLWTDEETSGRTRCIALAGRFSRISTSLPCGRFSVRSSDRAGTLTRSCRERLVSPICGG